MSGYNFTDRVRKVLQIAREEAARLQNEFVATEHLLLALIREGEGNAAAVLSQLNVDVGEIRRRVEAVAPRGKAAGDFGPDRPYTSRAKKAMEFAMSEARELNHAYVGTEHLLLGLLREERGVAAEVLTALGVTLERARAETLRLLGSEMPSGAREPGRRPAILARMRALVGELRATPAPAAGRLAAIATELESLLDELARMR
jgi:ATP-dependent Clp protease ATP-binding subunit ClpC